MKKKDIFKKVVKRTGVTGNGFADSIIARVLASIVHAITYFLVGIFYGLKVISGRKAGKVLYAIIWLLFLLGIVLLFKK